MYKHDHHTRSANGRPSKVTRDTARRNKELADSIHKTYELLDKKIFMLEMLMSSLCRGKDVFQGALVHFNSARKAFGIAGSDIETFVMKRKEIPDDLINGIEVAFSDMKKAVYCKKHAEEEKQMIPAAIDTWSEPLVVYVRKLFNHTTTILVNRSIGRLEQSLASWDTAHEAINGISNLLKEQRKPIARRRRALMDKASSQASQRDPDARQVAETKRELENLNDLVNNLRESFDSREVREKKAEIEKAVEIVKTLKDQVA